MPISFDQMPLWANGLIFAAAAVVVWLAGSRLAAYADEVARRTGLGHAFVGALLLGGISSLPEAVTTVTASAVGNAPIAANNLLGGVAMQVAILAVADIAAPGPAITSSVKRSSVLLQPMLLVVILAVTATGIATGDYLVFGVGAWTLGIGALSVIAFVLLRLHPERTWEPATALAGDGEGKLGPSVAAPEAPGLSTGGLVLCTALASLAILVAGAAVALSADALAEQTHLGSNFVGAVLVALTTSLPEISTTVAAVRLGHFTLAFSNVFGANILDLGILLLADAVYAGGPILGALGPFSLVAALLGIVLTGAYTAGLLRRRRRVVLGMGLDSAVVLLLYLAGLVLLYAIR